MTLTTTQCWNSAMQSLAIETLKATSLEVWMVGFAVNLHILGISRQGVY